MDQQSLDKGIWYADEEICQFKDYSNVDWVLKQKQLQRNKTTDLDTYFDIPFLMDLKRVKNGTKGLPPDKV